MKLVTALAVIPVASSCRIFFSTDEGINQYSGESGNDGICTQAQQFFKNNSCGAQSIPPAIYNTGFFAFTCNHLSQWSSLSEVGLNVINGTKEIITDNLQCVLNWFNHVCFAENEKTTSVLLPILLSLSALGAISYCYYKRRAIQAPVRTAIQRINAWWYECWTLPQINRAITTEINDRDAVRLTMEFAGLAPPRLEFKHEHSRDSDEENELLGMVELNLSRELLVTEENNQLTRALLM